MRKPILLVLTLSLCFMIGCEEEKEPIKEIENTEVQEFEEPITETKIEEPIAEINQEYVTISLKKDGVVTVYSTELKDELFNKTYVEPEFSSVEDFNFGDYGLFIGIATGSYSAEQIPKYSRGVITSKTKNIDEAMSLYEDFNNACQISTIGTEECFDNFDYIKHLIEKSYVVYISQEVDTFGIASVEDSKIWKQENTKDFFDRQWNGKYNICNEDGCILRSETSQDIAGWIYNDYGFKEIPSDNSLSSYTGNGRYYLKKEWDYLNEVEKVTVEFYATQHRFPLTDKKDITLSIESTLCWDVEDYDGKRYIVLRASSGWKKGIYALFLYDIFENKLELLENHASHSSLSPDGKYLAYTSPILTEWDTADFGQMKAGFYIKELETGETVFYNCEEHLGMYCQFIAGWVNEEKITKYCKRSWNKANSFCNICDQCNSHALMSHCLETG